ncbi:MAG: hypothetical protein LUD47_04185 [Clostridia bacterium]|nr:hypothetical protein [Clostridia bacterium]
MAKGTPEQQNLDLYLRAAANFYGHIMPGKFLNIYNKYNGVHLLKDDFLDLMYDYNPKGKCYRVYTNAVINTDVTNSAITRIAQGQEGKPYNILPKEQFIKWAVRDYFPNTPACQYFTEYLTVKCHATPAKASEATKNIYFSAMRGDDKMDRLTSYLTAAVEFDVNDMDLLTGLFGALMDFLNGGVPRWMNCGFTPNELRKREGFDF